MQLQQGLILQQTQKQMLVLNQAMIQSLSILAMPRMEMETMVKRELEENPLLELDESAADISLEEQWDMPGSSLSNEEYDPFYAITCEEDPLDDLYFQLHVLNLPEIIEKGCELLIASLDSRGYLPPDAKMLSALFDGDRKYFEQSLAVLQKLEPAGVGCRDLTECLLLQLGKEDVHAKEILMTCPEALVQANFEEIAKKLGISIEKAKEASRRILALNPIPLNGGAKTYATPYIIPEAIISVEDDRIIVERVASWMSRLRIVERYDDKLDQISAVDRQYIRTKQREGQRMIDNINRRYDTMERIILFIVEKQKDYFLHGSEYLTPMAQKDAARALELDDSTISRGVNGKYVRTPYGVSELKTFFTQSFENSEGMSIQTDKAKELLQKIIAEEDPKKPLSDQKIADEMKRRGSGISRRAVAKYREELKIPNGYERKKEYRLQDLQN